MTFATNTPNGCSLPEWVGGSWYAFDTRYEPMPVVEVDMNDPDRNYIRGASFKEFLENLHAAEE